MNQLPASPSTSSQSLYLRLTSSYNYHIIFPCCFTLLLSSTAPSFFHSQLKTYLYHKFLLLSTFFLPQGCLHGLSPGLYLLSYIDFCFLFFPLFFYCWFSFLMHINHLVLYHVVCHKAGIRSHCLAMGMCV